MNLADVFVNFVKHDKRQDDYNNILRRIKEERFIPTSYCFKLRFHHIFNWSTSCNHGDCDKCWKQNSKIMYIRKEKLL